MLRFLHTADLQIGMTAPGVGPMARRVQDARVESLERVLALGRDKNADFIIVAGDLFEHNRVSASLVERTAALLRTAPAPVFIIAGNHDYYGPDSVYNREEFRRSGENTVVFSERRPVTFSNFDVTIYPCPCFETRSPESPVMWVQKQVDTTYHVCIAHGNLPDRIAGSDHDYPMRDEELRRLDMDYIALGHWHSVHPDPRRDAASPYFYSGTPEPTKFGENRSGYSLLVELDRGARTVTELSTAQYRYLHIEREIRSEEDLRAISRELDALTALDTVLVKLVLSGVVSVDIRQKLDKLAEDVQRRVAFATIRDEKVSLIPNEEDLRRFPVDSMAARSLHRLRDMHDRASEQDRPIFSRAIALAYKAFSEEVQR